MQQYHDMLQHIMKYGVDKEDRTGTGTRSVFGYQMRFDLKEGFPLLGTKFTPFKAIAHELIWFLQGNPDISYLHDNNVSIWDEWVKEDGTFGPIYGHNWRSWGKRESEFFTTKGIDQIQNVIYQLKTNPDDRRMIVSAWNVSDVESGEMALPPCHVLFQFYTRSLTLKERTYQASRRGFHQEYDPKGYKWNHDLLSRHDVTERGLSCQLYQRSADTFLGVPFNIASYALLTEMIAQLVNMVPDEFIWTGGDTHIYRNHFDQVKELFSRGDPSDIPLPELLINPEVDDIDSFTMDDFKLKGYVHDGVIKAPVAV